MICARKGQNISWRIEEKISWELAAPHRTVFNLSGKDSKEYAFAITPGLYSGCCWGAYYASLERANVGKLGGCNVRFGLFVCLSQLTVFSCDAHIIFPTVLKATTLWLLPVLLDLETMLQSRKLQGCLLSSSFLYRWLLLASSYQVLPWLWSIVDSVRYMRNS